MSDVSFDEPEQKPGPPRRRGGSAGSGREQLLSSATSAAVDSAFNTLAQTVLVQNARTLEDLVREMLRPMLKTWLDDNLPGMVERLVRAEIERVSRGRVELASDCLSLRSHAPLSAAASFCACSASTAGSSLKLAGGFNATPILAWDDVEVQVKHHLAAGRLVELLDGDAVGGKHRHRRARDRLRRLDNDARDRPASMSRMLRAGALGITRVWPGARGMMSRKAKALSSS